MAKKLFVASALDTYSVFACPTVLDPDSYLRVASAPRNTSTVMGCKPLWPGGHLFVKHVGGAALSFAKVIDRCNQGQIELTGE